MENQLYYLEEINERILNPRRKELTNILLKFIDEAPQLLINESAEDRYILKVVNFEFDRPFSFSYVAYPGSNLIPYEYRNSIIDDLELTTDWEGLRQIFAENGFVESVDGGEWSNDKTSEFIDEWELCRNMECLWFHKCWQEAKSQSASKLRCFFIEHDIFGGIDADTGNFLTENEIKKVLTEEGLYNEIIYESKYIVHKNDRKELWGTTIKTFEELESAMEYLRHLLDSNSNKVSNEDFLIRKWLKMPHVAPDRDPWVIDTSFGKRFIELK